MKTGSHFLNDYISWISFFIDVPITYKVNHVKLCLRVHEKHDPGTYPQRVVALVGQKHTYPNVMKPFAYTLQGTVGIMLFSQCHSSAHIPFELFNSVYVNHSRIIHAIFQTCINQKQLTQKVKPRQMVPEQ